MLIYFLGACSGPGLVLNEKMPVNPAVGGGQGWRVMCWCCVTRALPGDSIGRRGHPWDTPEAGEARRLPAGRGPQGE